VAKLTEQVAGHRGAGSFAQLMAASRRAGGHRAHAKRMTARAARRAAKADPEDAPRQARFRGWSW